MIVVAGASLFVVTLTGKIFSRLLDIELYSFRIAGGILLAIVSIKMLYRKHRLGPPPTKNGTILGETRPASYPGFGRSPAHTEHKIRRPDDMHIGMLARPVVALIAGTLILFVPRPNW